MIRRSRCKRWKHKRRYVTEADALLVRDIRAAAGTGWGAVVAYSCEHCAGWHLGHPDGVGWARRCL